MRRIFITEREKEILKQVAKGKSSKEIADVIFRSVYTVETHRKNILKKLGAKNMMEAVSMYKRKRVYNQQSS